MKKILSVLFLSLLCLSLFGCALGSDSEREYVFSGNHGSKKSNDDAIKKSDDIISAQSDCSSGQNSDHSDLQPIDGNSSEDGGPVGPPFDLSDCTSTLYVEDGEEFVILNFTDFQLHNGISTYASFSIIDELIEKISPDLITVLGDTAEDSGEYGTKENFSAIVEHIDSFGIPWAPVFGNHDNEDYREPNSIKDTDDKWIVEKFSSSKNSLFKIGPDYVNGNGNYIVNVVNARTKKIAKSLFFFDTGVSGADDTHVEFYKDAAEYCKYLNGGEVSESIVFMHIPLPEYKIVWAEHNYEGIAGEQPSIGSGTTAFFAKIKEIGSTTHVICGHDHVNSFYANYQGVYLMYCLKSSDGDYYNENQLGGTTFTIGERTSFEYHFVNVANEVISPTFFDINSIDDFKNSGKSFSFEYKAVDNQINSGNKVSFTLWKSDWSKRVSALITVDVVNDVVEGGFGKIENIGNGWRKLTIKCSEMPINTYEGATGNETVGLIYFNTVEHAFVLDNVWFTDETTDSGTRTPVEPISDGGSFNW